MGRQASSVSVVVPVFNSAGTIDELVQRLARVMESLSCEWELILIDDGSQDVSWERIAEAARDPRVHGIKLASNFGQHNALLAGVNAAHNSRIVTLDDDLQNPPEEIPKLLDAIDGELDLVYGIPIDDQTTAPYRAGRAAVELARRPLLRGRLPHTVSAFRAFDARLRAKLGDRRGRRISLDALLGWSGGQAGTVPVRHDPRRSGRSNYTLLKLIRHAATELSAMLVEPGRRDRPRSYVVGRTTPEWQPLRDDGG
jgi:undecaprenyl-phosphate 4-deoxy-4-formamido-L-arabinose transferase